MMSRIFQPQWLETAEYQPILQEIYEFTKKFSVPPNIKVLHEVFKSKDETLYNNRFKDTLTELENAQAELPEVLYAIEKAKDVAISRSFMDLVNSPSFQELNEENEGVEQIKEVEKWLRLFQYHQDDVDLSIKEAIEKLIEETMLRIASPKYSCGLEFIDRWSGGGIRPKNLAVILAPTGHGKSMFLMIVAHNIARQGGKVLFISNELSMEEMTARFLSRITGEKLDQIMDDPSIGYHGLERHWKLGLDDNLRLLEVNREMDTDEIEALILKLTANYGWRPDVIVIDFMERMKPTVSGVKRDQSWNWLGYIGQDLVRMAKRGNWLVWTAGQTNRRGVDAITEQSLDQAQGSIKHLQEAALVVAMRQNEKFPLDDPDAVLLQFKPLKSRHFKKPGKSILVEAKFGNMIIRNTERDPADWISKEENVNTFPMKNKKKGEVKNDS